jgi:hypothetical protein
MSMHTSTEPAPLSLNTRTYTLMATYANHKTAWEVLVLSVKNKLFMYVRLLFLGTVPMNI